ncbi:hypothetical protein OE88DRAFT_825825 [Heliocybe sulcata]|uniref:Uncharacterized protein n=1 Tax=Heliocybe sulcata TaxID=5364 RepID=A0A5C3MTU5_9AGAM|nr:hypothetical protein OE88DRAFT_825825 [Heliocybe sulcata]
MWYMHMLASKENSSDGWYLPCETQSASAMTLSSAPTTGSEYREHEKTKKADKGALERAKTPTLEGSEPEQIASAQACKGKSKKPSQTATAGPRMRTRSAVRKATAATSQAKEPKRAVATRTSKEAAAATSDAKEPEPTVPAKRKRKART